LRTKAAAGMSIDEFGLELHKIIAQALMATQHFRTAMHEFVEHYHRERNHQGLDNEIIDGQPSVVDAVRIHRRQRLGGLLNYYCRAA
jgi:hypothetical protein